MAHLLVASTQANVRLALRHILERAGHSFALAADRAELLASLESCPWDALLIEPQFASDVPATVPLVFLGPDEALAKSRGDRLLGTLSPGEGLDAVASLLGKLASGGGPRVRPAEQPATVERIHVSALWAEVEEALARYAAHDVSVLILGESGTGKELVARGLHTAGRTPGAPFLAIHCGAIPADLLESELFGHEKGAFTDAHRRKPGQFEAAGKGTIFLDEIGEMSPALQAKLLRALQEKRFRPVGGNQEITLRARVVAATHRDLRQMVQRGEFREDLFHRLQVGVLRLPPLRERPEDMLPLCREFLLRIQRETDAPIQGIDAEAWELLRGYAWPGNVRQLENALRRAAIHSRTGLLSPSDFAELESSTASGESWRRTIREELHTRMKSGQPMDEAIASMEADLRALRSSLDEDPA